MMYNSALGRLAAIAFATAFQSVSAFALEQKPFDASAFKAAQDAGKPAIVHVHADWCPTCVSQKKAIKALEGDSTLNDVTVFTIDFDNQADAWKGFKATTQSTLIAFSGSKETGRLVGETAAKPIADLVHGTLAK